MNPTTTAAIKAIAYHLPEYVLTNGQLARELGAWDEEKITAKTGIVSRRLAAPTECASDLGAAAARALFETGACAPEGVDFLLYCTQSPDYLLPTTACLLQDRLGLGTGCGAVDINQGCSGFVYGLAMARALVENGTARNVLLITAETYSKYINPRDRSARTIFGDGAAATLIGPAGPGPDPIGPFVFGTDGSGAPNLIVPSGGSRRPRTPETAVEREDVSGNLRSDDNLYMNGGEIFAFTLEAVPAAVRRLLRESGSRAEDVDYFIFHQANIYMLERLRAKLEIPPEKFAVSMEDTGNTVSSTIPIALARARARGQVRPGDRVMLVGFGVGYSWAAAMMRCSY
jgi:3-oxoacyl-[acyl-carrier-protein] synthase-3